MRDLQRARRVRWSLSDYIRGISRDAEAATGAALQRRVDALSAAWVAATLALTISHRLEDPLVLAEETCNCI